MKELKNAIVFLANSLREIRDILAVYSSAIATQIMVDHTLFERLPRMKGEQRLRMLSISMKTMKEAHTKSLASLEHVNEDIRKWFTENYFTTALASLLIPWHFAGGKLQTFLEALVTTLDPDFLNLLSEEYILRFYGIEGVKTLREFKELVRSKH